MARYSKHLAVIRDIQYDLGDNFTFEYSLDNIFINTTFNFPYVQNEQFDTTNFSKYDAVKIYYNEFDTAAEANSATITNLVKIFDGYIDKLPLTLDKQSGYQYSITCKSRMGLSFERTAKINLYTGTLFTFLQTAIENSGLSEWITNINLEGINRDFVLKIDSSKFFGEVLENIKDKYALHIYEDSNNVLNIKTPFFLSQQSSIDAYEYIVDENVYDIDFGDLTNRIDTVICVGTNAVGVAFDPIAYQLKFGTSTENIVTNPTIDPAKLNIRYVYRRDVFNQQECQEIARNTLVDLAKNNTISFSTQFIPTQTVGEPFIIRNAAKIPESQLWTIKSITFNLGKQQNNCTIVGYSNSIIDFPEDILLSNTGILSTDILQITEKVEDSLQLR